VSKFKPQQRYLTIRGREYHFVSYEGRSASRRHPQPAPAMWYLMVEGHRCPVVPCNPALSPADLDAALAAWVSSNAQGPAPVRAAGLAVGAISSIARRAGNWW